MIRIYLVCTAVIFFTSCSNEKKGDQQNGEIDTASMTTTPGTKDSIPQIAEPDHTDVRENEIQEEVVKYTYTGEVMLKGDAWVIRTTVGNDMTDFLPSNLDEEFQKQGIKVMFNGTPGEIPPNVRMAGRPFTITDIAIAK